MANNNQLPKPAAVTTPGINKITVAGYKSIAKEQCIEIRPLTILAGSNSSGKSSMMQPLLLLKQTLEASYDPGILLLDGPNIRFTSSEQLLSHKPKDSAPGSFFISLDVEGEVRFSTRFIRELKKGFAIGETTYRNLKEKRGDNLFWKKIEITLKPNMSHREIISKVLPTDMKGFLRNFSGTTRTNHEWVIARNRCFLELAVKGKNETNKSPAIPFTTLLSLLWGSPRENIEQYIRELIHLPGLRGNPERTYPVTAVGTTFPGTFEKYVASVIANWQEDKGSNKLERLGKDLNAIGLTWKVAAKPIKDTQVELQVGRLTSASSGNARDMVSIADVGLGVSQTLPVIVALHAAKRGQLVFLEQPEIHLHPRAQTAMAKVLADAARRGVRVVAETHSALLILGIQTLVAEGRLDPSLVKLHWFERKGGTTRIKSADLDDAGSFGDWPEDFADVALEAQSNYLDAAESRIMEKRRAN